MEAYIRHFVSQHLGKAIATVEWCGDDAGQVRISVPQLSPVSIEYAFVCAQVTQLGPERAEWAETIARIAIHQAQKQFLLRGRVDLFGPGRALAADTPPWIGDLAPLPYGGATDGYAQRSG